MNHSSRKRLVILLCLISASWLPADARTCRLIYPERTHTAPKTAYLFDGFKSRNVMLPNMNFSEVIDLPDGEITLAMTVDKITDSTRLSATSPQVKVPEAVKDLYILIRTDAENKELPLLMELIDVSDGQLKAGQTLWRNFTNDRIIAKLGDADLSLDSSASRVSEAPAPKPGHFNATFSYQLAGEGEPRPITEQSWWHDDKSKHLGLVLNSGGKLPKILYFRDFRTPAE
jgi:hypothetical protein